MPAHYRNLPLNAIRVFEAAARHLSFTRAADELCVTNAAISHQIKSLEEHLGLKLFERHNNRLSLTTAGENYLPRVRDAFRALQQATEMLTGDKESALKVWVPAAFGSKWLVPRLYRFLDLYPDIRVEIFTENRSDAHDYDLIIDFRPLNNPHFQHWLAEPFLTSALVPVCSPALQSSLRSVSDLARHTLLHNNLSVRSPLPGWRQWLEAVDAGHIELRRSLSFNDTLMILQAAIDSQGVALVADILVEYDVAAHRLIKPLLIETPLQVTYYLHVPDDSHDATHLNAFRHWLRTEAAS